MNLRLLGLNQRLAGEIPRQPPPAPLVSVQPLGPPPKIPGDRWMGFLLDTSTSMATPMAQGSRLDAVRRATLSSVEDIARESPDTRVWLASFDSIFGYWMAPTSAQDCVFHARWALEQMNALGETNFEMALWNAKWIFGLREDAENSQPPQPPGFMDWLLGAKVPPRLERLVLLFLSDGENTGADPMPLAEAIKAMGVEIHTVGVGRTPMEVDERLLEAIASWDRNAGKPHYRFIGDPVELQVHFQEVAGGLVIRG